MARKRADDLDPLDRVLTALDDAPPGLHDVDPPADELPPGLPDPLIELYARCDGARLFVDTLELVASRDVRFDNGRWRFALVEGDPVTLDHHGKVWRFDPSIEDDVCDGTRLDRWLAGQVDAIGELFDGDGEYADDVFDEDGEILVDVRERMLRAQIKRDAAAPAPRWRLAHVLIEQGATENARDQLEQVVADDPAFAWAWLDLARVSERLGEIGGAIDEARMAADVAEGVQHPQAGYFWSQVARLAARAGDGMTRAEAATKASLLAPGLKRAQIEGAKERLDAGDTASAKGLVELLRAVWPRDLEVLELAKRL
ncbi:MAG: tetratricopeptide repeat protein [Acidobacteriota bacterium]